MKKTILFLFFNYITVAYGQLNMFGIDVSKHISYGTDVYYKKIALANNSYFTIVEYKGILEMKTLLFDDYTAKVETPQMKYPEKYLLELKGVVSKSMGKNLDLYKDTSLTTQISDNYMWVKKYKDKYLVGILKYSDFSKRNDFRIIIYSIKAELIKGLDLICSGQYSWAESCYYDPKDIENL